MSLAEYNLRMTAYQERRKEAEKEAMARLWLQERVLKATDKDGTHTIKTWDDFYPEDKPKPKVNPMLYKVAENLRKYREKGGTT